MKIHFAEIIPQNRSITSPLIHWNYFLSIEADLVNLSRYVDFSEHNFNTYSVELGRVIMAATQECDVLLKQICGDDCKNEASYRQKVCATIPNFLDQNIHVPRFNLSFKPFLTWASDTTPEWWTANNKVKHQRHEHFKMANLKNALHSVGALLICNIYFYHKESRLKEIQPIPQLFVASNLMRAVQLTAVGIAPDFNIETS